MRLTHAELEAFHGTILALHRYRDLDEFLAEAPAILARVTPRARLTRLAERSPGSAVRATDSRHDTELPLPVEQDGGLHVEFVEEPLAPGTVSSRDGDGMDIEHERVMLDLLRPHLELAWCNARLVSIQRSHAKNAGLEVHGLTPREADVAHWLALGKTNAEIARILGSSARTIEKHVERVLEKLGVENRTSAALLISNSGGR